MKKCCRRTRCLRSRTYIEQNEVVVVNWEKIRSKNRSTGEWKNKVMREGETVINSRVLARIKLRA